MTPCRCRVCNADRWAHRLIGVVLGVLLGVLLSLLVVVDAASRSAHPGVPLASSAVRAGQSGAPLGYDGLAGLGEWPQRDGLHSASGLQPPTATVIMTPAPSANSTFRPEAFIRPTISKATTTGIASYMAPAYGRRYLALPAGPGIRVRVCGAADCIVRTSTDAGPDLEMQRAGRIVDLSWWDWQTVSGLSPTRGLAPVSVEVLR